MKVIEHILSTLLAGLFLVSVVCVLIQGWIHGFLSLDYSIWMEIGSRAWYGGLAVLCIYALILWYKETK